LRTSKRAKKRITNIFNYDLLTNFRYADEFFYTQMAMREPEDTGSDYISKVLYLGAEKAGENDGDNQGSRAALSPSNHEFSHTKL